MDVQKNSRISFLWTHYGGIMLILIGVSIFLEIKTRKRKRFQWIAEKISRMGAWGMIFCLLMSIGLISASGTTVFRNLQESNRLVVVHLQEEVQDAAAAAEVATAVDVRSHAVAVAVVERPTLPAGPKGQRSGRTPTGAAPNVFIQTRTPLGERRQLPFGGGLADFLANSANGSFWLPRPPENPIEGYAARQTGNTFQTGYYANRSGFIFEDHVDVMMSKAYNAGDFYSYWLAPMLAGRRAATPEDESTNRCSLAMTGSILHWGIRYNWGSGTIESDDKITPMTEVVFAQRGPLSYEHVKQSPHVSKHAPVFGDPGLFMSWFYQPHQQTKNYTICMIPHYADENVPFMKMIRKNHPHIRVLNIRDPLFHLMDEIVKCRVVLSSSLHGMVFSDSYAIPNARVILSSYVTGGKHKFDDYCRGVGRTPGRTCPTLANLTNLIDLNSFASQVITEYDTSSINLMPLWGACPMHAEANGMTRQQHTQFAQNYASVFSSELTHRPAGGFQSFQTNVERRMAQYTSKTSG